METTVDFRDHNERVRLAEVAWAARIERNRAVRDLTDLINQMYRAANTSGESALADALDAAYKTFKKDQALAVSIETLRAALANVPGHDTIYRFFSFASFRAADADSTFKHAVSRAVKDCGNVWEGYAYSHVGEVEAWIEACDAIRGIHQYTTDDDEVWIRWCDAEDEAKEMLFGVPESSANVEMADPDLMLESMKSRISEARQCGIQYAPLRAP